MQKPTYYMDSFIWNIQDGKIHTYRKQISDCLELGEIGVKYEWMTANGYGDSFGDDKSVLELEHGMVIPLWIFKTTDLYTWIFKTTDL